MFFILNINKPKGFTSHDVVAKLRKILNTKKIGHTGTLDPLATGVLPICVGKATKLIQYLDDTKAYRATAKLGIKTDSYDTEGQILEENPVNIDLEQIKTYLQDFQGNITQKPPIYSAVHYKGKRLYEYARKNIEIPDIPERNVTVNSINLVEIKNTDSNHPELVIDIDCSSGTYIRSIIHDLGEKLGCGATMSGLIRTRAGRFNLENSYSIEEIAEKVENNSLNEAMITPSDIITLEKYSINDIEYDKIQKGQYIENKLDLPKQKIQLIYQNNLSAIAEIKELDNNYKIFPINVF